MYSATKITGLRTRLATVLICVCAATTVGWALAATGLSYEGPFCTKVPLAAGGHCNSSTVSARRAVGRSEGGSTEIAMVGELEELTNHCREAGCETGTGYLKKPGGFGKVINIGVETHNYYGYLYP